MSRSRPKGPWQSALALAVLAAALWTGKVALGPAFSAASGAAPTPAPRTPPAPASTNTLAGPASSRPPVETFRELLAMNPFERKRSLADRPPHIQRRILAKIREYESLSPNQRELRLKATELYYYLWPLLNTAPTGRQPLLAAVPESDRPEIEKRLQAWDLFPTGRQQELLTNAAAAHFFTELENGPPPLPPASPAQQVKLQQGIAQWQALPRSQQQKITARFKRFLELTPEEQQQACNTLSETERRQIQRTLHRFENLTIADRVKAVDYFEKFASLTYEQRRDFLKNAEVWKLMTPNQRQEWRDLVNAMPELPPFPPGLQRGPPMPPGILPPRTPAKPKPAP
jgi:hypothetical protein